MWSGEKGERVGRRKGDGRRRTSYVRTSLSKNLWINSYRFLSELPPSDSCQHSRVISKIYVNIAPRNPQQD